MVPMVSNEVPGEEAQGPLDEGDLDEPAHTEAAPLVPLNTNPGD